LLKYLGKTVADDEPLPFGVILDSNGLEDALWCCHTAPEHNRVWRLYAVWCARQVQRLMTDQRSLNALNVAERHANGQATDGELFVAWAAAGSAVWAAAGDAARETALAAVLAARDAAGIDAGGVAGVVAGIAAWSAARAARTGAFDAGVAAFNARAAGDAGDTEAATWAAGDAAREAAQTAQAAKLREMVGDR